MSSNPTDEQTWTLGTGALVLGILGLVFCWVVPLGVIISLGGVALGVFGWLTSPPGAANRRLVIGGTLFALGVFFFTLVMATGGLDAMRDTFFPWLW
jgi:hypothetical protein